jgi:hypothetical protein
MKTVDFESNSDANRNRLLLSAPPQAFVGADQDDGTLPDFSLFEQGMCEIAHVRCRLALNAIKETHEWPSGESAFLSLAQLRRRYHLHRLRDLRGIPDRMDPAPQFSWTMHRSRTSPCDSLN